MSLIGIYRQLPLTCCLCGQGELTSSRGNPELAEEYQSKTDDELLRLALDSEQLTPEAGVALHDELARRRIEKNEQLPVFIQQEEQRKEEQRRNPGNLFVFHPYGVGRDRFGKAGRIYSPETGKERFKTTVC